MTTSPQTGLKKLIRLVIISLITLSVWFAVMAWPVTAAHQVASATGVYVPPASPQSGWNGFTPTTWLTSSNVTAGVSVTDTAGLNLTTAVYRYSNNGGAAWEDWQTAPAGSDISTEATISTPLLILNDGITHAVQFAISNTATIPEMVLSTSYPVRVDSVPPVAAIRAPQTGAVITQVVNNQLVITGTVEDATSGAADVEISVDEKQNWQPAVGVSTWAYTWTTTLVDGAVYTLYIRAADNAGNLQSPGLPVTFTYRPPTYNFLPMVIKGPTDTFEPNDSRSTSYGPLNSGQMYTSYMWSTLDNWDCYWFEPHNLGQATINLTSIPAGTDYDLYLYDSLTATNLATSKNYGTANEQIIYNLKQLTRHYVCINRYSGYSNTDSYLLQVTHP